MKFTVYAAVFALAFAGLVPQQAAAQSYDEIIAGQDYGGNGGGRGQYQQREMNTDLIYGDGGSTQESGGEDTNDDYNYKEADNRSYDEMAVGEDGYKDLYSYVGREQRNYGGDPTKARQQNAMKAHKEALAAHAASIKKLQANSQKLLADQKKRAWLLAHPGEDYPGDDDEGAEEASYGGDDSGDNGYAEEEPAPDADGEVYEGQ